MTLYYYLFQYHCYYYVEYKVQYDNILYISIVLSYFVILWGTVLAFTDALYMYCMYLHVISIIMLCVYYYTPLSTGINTHWEMGASM